MSHKPMNTDGDSYQSLAPELVSSELNYFRAGAGTVPLSEGELLVTTGFELLPAACVLHNVDGSRISVPVSEWLIEVEEHFRKIGASLSRIYCTAESQRLEIEASKRNYKRVREIGLVGRLTQSSSALKADECELVGIVDEIQFAQRKELYRAASHGPDGHNMVGGRFSDLEKIKQQSGYMTSFLYYYRDCPVAAVSLALRNDFARLKNLLVHPDYQGKGLGKRLVQRIMEKAKLMGATNFGVYAEQGKAGHHIYLACGLQEVTSQLEFSKMLSG